MDWWVPSTDHSAETSIDELKPLRVHAADNHDLIFDVRGVRSIVDLNEGVIAPRARKFRTSSVRTHFYDEDTLSSRLLRSRQDDAKIAQATEAIRGNAHFLAAIPSRQSPFVPAHQAAKFTYGRCAVFAEALRELTGLRRTDLTSIQLVRL